MSQDVGNPTQEQLAQMIGERAENLYCTNQLLCSEAVLVVLNKGLGGGLPDEIAIRLASALPIGMGKSGCTCGALSGAVQAVGLFLGRDRPGLPDRRGALSAANLLHNRFKDRFGSTCCRVLSQKVKHDSKEHFKQCARITRDTAEFAALIILDKDPSLVADEAVDYLKSRDSWVGAKVRQLLSFARR